MNEDLQLAFCVSKTEAEGPGKRFALWVQGCTLGCPDCCNPEMWSKKGGETISVDELYKKILTVSDKIEGVSLLGGEPFEQDRALSILARKIRDKGLTVMVYSGYDLKEIKDMKSELLEHVDVLVAGRYVKELHTTKRRWIGSTNQELHFLTDAYKEADPRFLEPNHAEITLNSQGEMTVVGFPFPSIRENFRKKSIEV